MMTLSSKSSEGDYHLDLPRPTVIAGLVLSPDSKLGLRPGGQVSSFSATKVAPTTPTSLKALRPAVWSG